SFGSQLLAAATLFFFFLVLSRPPASTLFPYTTLFRSFEQLETRYPPSSYAMFVAVGFSKLNRIRTELYGLCKRRGYELITYINRDRKSTRLNSSHRTISYAVFCLKKKNYRRSISSPSY